MKQFLCRASIVVIAVTTTACGTDVPLRPESPFYNADASQSAAVLSRSGNAVGFDSSSITPDGVAVMSSRSSAPASREYRLEVGSTTLFQIEPRQYQRFTRFESSDSEIAEVSPTGVIRGRASGTAQVTGRFGGTTIVADVIVMDADEDRPTVNQLHITPKFGTALPFGGARQFSASESWTDGRMRPASSVTYSATGGTVTTMGLYTAGQKAGLFRVIAACICGLADTAVVQVGTAEAQLTSLTISPKTATVQPGTLQTFKSSVRWTTGDTTPPALTYSSSGGTVSNLGLYRAPTQPGSYRVIVAHNGGTLRDTATITVPSTTSPDPATPAPPPPPSGNGAEPFFQDNFDSGVQADANGFRWRDLTNVTVSTEKPFQGSHSLRFNYAGKPKGSDATAELRFDLGRKAQELWVEYYIHIPANFHVRRDYPANNKFFMMWAERYSKSGDLQVGTEFEINGETSTVARILSMSEGYATHTIRKDGFQNERFLTHEMRNTWQRVRIHFKASSGSGKFDGVYEGWLGDTLMWRSKNWSFWYEGGNNYLKKGYLMGWANSGYDESTQYFIDEIKFYDRDPGWQ